MHFIAYHNSDNFGPFNHQEAAKRGDEQNFVTAKSFRSHTLIGQRLWAIEGSGTPKRYSLVSSGITNRLTKWKRPAKFRKRGQEFGTRVHFKVDADRQANNLNGMPWFQKLLRQQQSFRNGFNRIADEDIIQSLKDLPHRKSEIEKGWAHEDPAFDLEKIFKTTKSPTNRKTLIDARLGQGRFRAQVGKRWNNCCAVTGCKIPDLLRASHIKPWSKCTNNERLNPHNGLLLAAHIDALFDRGLITFSDTGKMLISDRIDLEERRRLRLPGALRRRLSNSEKRFLIHHRDHRFSASND
jgi:hypothetical protein